MFPTSSISGRALTTPRTTSAIGPPPSRATLATAGARLASPAAGQQGNTATVEKLTVALGDELPEPVGELDLVLNPALCEQVAIGQLVVAVGNVLHLNQATPHQPVQHEVRSG